MATINNDTLKDFKKQFRITQLGYIAEYSVPYNLSISLDDAVRIFKNNENINTLPIESYDKIIGVIDRETALEKGKSKIELMKGKTINNYIEKNFKRYEARDFCERVMLELMKDEGKSIKNLIIYDYSHFLGIITLNNLIKYVITLRENSFEQAHSIQQFYLEKSIDTIEGINYAKFIKMAHHIGGDFIHIQSFPNNVHMIACFDVSGKDIAASLTTSLLSSFFTMYKWTIHDTFNPDDMFQKINNLIMEQTPTEIFVAAAFLFIFTDLKTIKMYNFGFSPIYLYIPEQQENKLKIRIMNPLLMPLGIKPDIDLSNASKTIPLRKGLKFFLYSDGCIDIMNKDGIKFGDENLKKLIIQNFKLSPGKFIENLKNTYLKYSEETIQADDITAIIAEVS